MIPDEIIYIADTCGHSHHEKINLGISGNMIHTHILYTTSRGCNLGKKQTLIMHHDMSWCLPESSQHLRSLIFHNLPVWWTHASWVHYHSFFGGSSIRAYTSKKIYYSRISRTINNQNLYTLTKSSLFTRLSHINIGLSHSSFQPCAPWLVHHNWPRVPVDFHLSMPHSQSRRVFHAHGAPVEMNDRSLRPESRVWIISQDCY